MIQSIKPLSKENRTERFFYSPIAQAALLVLFLCFAQPVVATDYVVNSTADDADGSTAGVSLREAILAANSNGVVGDAAAGEADGDTITFDPATFPRSFSTAINLSGNGEITITDDLRISGASAGVILIGQSSTRVFNIEAGENVVLEDLQIASGNGDGVANDGLGGNIYSGNNTPLILRRVQLLSGSANLSGGGLYQESGTLIVEDCSIRNNRADGPAATDGGGAIFTQSTNFTIKNSNFTNNLAVGASGSGGALFISDASGDVQAVISDSEFNANFMTRAGGAIETLTTSNQIDLRISDSDFSTNGFFNIASPGNGGAIHTTSANDDDTTLTINSSQFTDNRAGLEGGSVWIDGGVNATIKDSRFENGSLFRTGGADSGGGALYSNGGDFTIINSFFSNNNSGGSPASGGAMLINGGATTIRNSTFLGNSTSRAGGAIEVSTLNGNVNLTLTDSSLSGNSASNSPGNGGAIHITDPINDNGATVTISRGQIIGNVASQEGGGLWNDAGSVMNLDSVLVQSNVAQAQDASGDVQGGGGVFNNGGQVVITDSTINGNFAQGDGGTDDGGAGILNDGRNNSGASVTIAGSMVSNNDALTGLHNGGGILNVGGANATTTTVSITDSMLKENVAARAGGAIENNNGVVQVSGSVMDSNRAGINGGAVHISADGILALTDTKVTSNNAVNEGGGLWNSNGTAASITLTRVQLSNNSAKDGGALFNDGADGAITAANSVISGNNAGRNGGGIDTEGGTLALSYTTVANNMSETNDDDDSDADGGEGNGGGINADNGATVTLDSSIVADNVGNSGTGNDIVSGSAITASFSLVEDPMGGHGVTTGTNNNIVSADPNLLVLADSGGAIFTHALEVGSPATDTGNTATCPTTDARNNMRPVGAGCDIGSYEATAGEVDCNMNSISDDDDITAGTSIDCDNNGIPDECQNDTDMDGTIDSCEMCPMDAGKTAPGVCGCGSADSDDNDNQIADCLIEDAAFEQAATIKNKINRLTVNTKRRRLFGVNVLIDLAAQTEDSDLQLLSRRVKAVARRIRRLQGSERIESGELTKLKRVALRRLNRLQDALQVSADS